MIPAAAEDIVEPQSHSFIALGKFKFQGAQSCGGANCHGAAQESAAPSRLANQLITWSQQDKHATAFQALKKDNAAQIGLKLNIADVASSGKCLGCHAVDAPEALRGDQFDLKEGVTCNACHGPSSDWDKPHVEAGWTNKMRQQCAGNSQQLLQSTGLYDTKDISARFSPAPTSVVSNGCRNLCTRQL